MVKPFIIGTRNAGDFLYGGVNVLKNGGSALAAIETATRLVELNPNDTSVGMSGIPNLLGVQEMDASIMCGKTMQAGAVGALKGYKHPISVAKKVLDHAPHVMLVGDGAELFAHVMGCERGDLSTEISRNIYDTFVRDAFEHEEIEESQQWVKNYVKSQKLREWYDKLTDNQHGTVNIIAMDENGDIASAISTSGTALKFPGRLGDSPIIGAGNYCDNRYGAATCTGRGELAIRNSTARTIIHYMENGLTVKEAAFRAMKDIHLLKSFGGMNCIAIDHKGNTVSATTNPNKESVYWYMDLDSKKPEKRIGISVTR
jgi:beta-aspartyl-peptidase (threonine type)